MHWKPITYSLDASSGGEVGGGGWREVRLITGQIKENATKTQRSKQKATWNERIDFDHESSILRVFVTHVPQNEMLDGKRH